MSDPSPPEYVLLRGAEPGMAATPCHACGEPAFPGSVFVGVVLQPAGHAGFLCPDCAHSRAPALAAVASAVNTLLALAPELDPGDSLALAGALKQIARRLPAPAPAGRERTTP